MTTSFKPKKIGDKKAVPKLLKSQIIIISLLIICLGIFFRVNNLDRKAYWLDESFTSLSVSGYSREDVKQQLITGKEISTSTIEKYQYPNEEVDYRGTIEGLIADEPQHTPLYFLSARFWLQLFGSSIIAIRTLSVVAGILCLPLMYWLCQELFQQPLISWIATASMAVSPFHLLYSQEARPFSLWTLTTLLSCILLLEAQKKRSLKIWLLYSLSMTVSSYTFLFSLLTGIAHFVYILLSEKLRFNKNTISILGSGLLTLICFSPWLLIIKNDPPSNYTSVSASSFAEYPKAWLRNLSLPFADFNINNDSSLQLLLPFALYLLTLVIFVAYAFFYLANNSNQKSYLFLGSLLIIPSLILLIHDFGKGGQMSLRANYLIPSLLSIQITVAYTLARSILTRNRPLWLGVTGIFLSISIASCLVMNSSDVWWNKADENIHQKLADVINQTENPVIISDVLTDDEFIKPMAVSHYLKDTAKFILLFEPTEGDRWKPLTLLDSDSDIFLYAPSESLKNNLAKNYGYTIVPLFEKSDLYCDCPDEVFFKLEPDRD